MSTTSCSIGFRIDLLLLETGSCDSEIQEAGAIVSTTIPDFLADKTLTIKPWSRETGLGWLCRRSLVRCSRAHTLKSFFQSYTSIPYSRSISFFRVTFPSLSQVPLIDIHKYHSVYWRCFASEHDTDIRRQIHRSDVMYIHWHLIDFPVEYSQGIGNSFWSARGSVYERRKASAGY
jgi:hypothetical protein